MTWRTRLASATSCLVLLVGCSSGGKDGDASSRPTPPPRSQMDELLAQYPECPEPKPGRNVSKIRGLLLPEGTEAYTVRKQGPITTVQGFVPMTPVEVREYFETDPDIEVIVSEDEFVESELLFTDGTFRNFVKARASCKEGSDVVTVIAKELSALPVPSGTAGPAASASPTAP